MDVLNTVGLTDVSLKAIYNQRILSQRDTTINDLIDDAVNRVVATDKAINDNKPTKVIPQVLHIDQRNALSSNFPAYNLEYTNKDLNSHGIAAAITKLSYDLMLDSISYNKFTSVRSKGIDDKGRTYDDYVCIIGGNPAKLVKQRMHAVHSCNPILDAKDSVRCTDRIEQVRLYLDALNAKKDKTLEDNTNIKLCHLFLSTNIITCRNLAQDCSRTARYILAIDSTYDISLKQLADIMVKKRALFMRGCMMFDPSIFKQQHGKIPGIEATFRKENGYIIFNFRNDMSIEYRHSLRNYLSYFTTGNFYNSDMSVMFQMEMLENRLGVQYFKVSRVVNNLKKVDVMSHSIWFSAMHGMTVVTCYSTDIARLAKGRNRWWGRWAILNRERRKDIGNSQSKCFDTYDGVFKKRYVLVKTSIIDRLRNFAFGSTEQKFKAAEIFNYLRSITSEIFFGNEIVKKDDPLDNTTMMSVSMAVYVEQYLKKYDLGKAQQQLLIDIAADRELALKSIPFKIFHSRNTCYDSSVWPIFSALHAMLFWLKSSTREYERMLVPTEDYLPITSKRTTMFSIAEMKVKQACTNLIDKTQDALNRKNLFKYEYHATHNFSYCPVAVRTLGDEYCEQIAHNIKENFCVDTTTAEIREYLNEKIDEAIYGGSDKDCSLNYNDTIYRWKLAIVNYIESDHYLECEAAMDTIRAGDDFTTSVFARECDIIEHPDLVVGDIGDSQPDEDTKVVTMVYDEDKEYYHKLVADCIRYYYVRGLLVKSLVCNVSKDKDSYFLNRKENLDTLKRYKAAYSLGIDTPQSSIDQFERDLMRPTEIDITPDRETYAALQLVENLTARGGSSFLLMDLPQVIAHFDRIHAVSRWFRDVNVSRVCYWHAVSTVVAVKFTDRCATVGDYASSDLADFSSSRIKLITNIHKLLDYHITDLYRASEGKFLTRPIAQARPVTPSAPRDAPPPYPSEQPPVNPKFVTDEVRKLSLERTDEYKGVVYRHKMKLHSLLLKLELTPKIILELGAAPGIWTQLLHGKFPTAEYHAVSISDGLPYKQKIFSDKLTYFDQDALNYLEDCHTFYDLIISDVATADTWKDSTTQTRIATMLRRHMNPHTTVIVKFSNMFTDIGAIEHVFAGYTTGFIKPIGSRNRSTEVYFVATPMKVSLKTLLDVRSSALTAMHNILLTQPALPNICSENDIDLFFTPSLVDGEPKDTGEKQEDGQQTASKEEAANTDTPTKDPESVPIHVSASLFLKQHQAHTYYQMMLDEDCSIIDVPRDGYCLYYALTGNCVHNVHTMVSELKSLAVIMWGKDSPKYRAYIAEKEKCNWGDIDDMELFSRLKTVKVYVYDFKNKRIHQVGSGSSTIKVVYDGSHYYALLVCPNKSPKPVDHDMSPTTFDDDQYVRWLDGTISKDSVREKSVTTKALNYVARVSSSYTGTTYNLCDADRTLFKMERFCDKHTSCNFDYFKTQIAATDVTSFTAVVWNSPSYLALFAAYVADNNYYCTAVSHPMIYYAGYCVFKLRPKSEHDVAHDPVGQSAFINHHMTVCGKCVDVKAWSVLNYHYITKIGVYSTCAQSLATVIPTTKYEPDIPIFKLVKNTSKNFRVEPVGNYVHIGVRFDSVSAIDKGCLKHVESALQQYLTTHQLFRPTLQFDGVGAANTDSIIEMLSKYCTILYDTINVADTSKTQLKFKPETKSPFCKANKRMNACFEALEMARHEKTRILDELQRYAAAQKEAILRVSKSNHKTIATMSTGKLAAIDFNVGKYAIKKCDFDYKGTYAKGYSYETESVVDISDCFSGDEPIPKPGYGIVVYTKECRMFNSDKIYDTISNRKCLLDNVDRLHITYVDGAPGVGKTRYILDSLHGNTNDTQTMVLCVSKHSAESFRKKAIDRFGFDVNIARLKFRTLDSLLMHFAEQEYPSMTRKLYVDEGMMEHIGKILWAALLLNAMEIVIIGDKAQIPFINRDKTRCLHYHKIDSVVPDKNTYTTKNDTFVSYRMPQDATHLLNSLRAYPKIIRTYNSVVNSINLVLCPEGTYQVSTRKFDQHPTSPLAAFGNLITPEVVVLTYMQNDKKTIREHLKANGRENAVHTIGEYQGSETEKIILIRLSSKPNPVYDEPSQQLVGISRHTQQFTYITPITDALSKTIMNRAHEFKDIQRLYVSTKGGGILAGPRQNKQFPVFLVNYTAPKTFDMLKQNGFLRDFVVANRGYNIIPTRAALQKIHVPLPTDPVIPTCKVGDPVNVLQTFIDAMVPGGSTRLMEHDNLRFEEEPFYVTNACSVREIQRIKTERFDTYRSSIRTHCPAPVWDTQKQYLKAFSERNGGVPDYGGTRDNVVLVEEMLQNFKTAYLRPPFLSTFQDSEIDINVDSLEDWLKDKPQSVLELMKSDEDYSIFDKKLDTYSMMLKKLPKIVTDAEAAYKNKSPQTILYHCQSVNAVFSPIVREMKSRLVSGLLANKIIATDLSSDELEELMSTRFPPSMIKNFCQTVEGDIGKFDKSQEMLALMFELKIMTFLGFPKKYLGLWVYMHVYTRMIARNAGFSAHVHYQRKSGDAMTFLGNTLFLMAVVATTYGADITRRSVGWFAGDDYYMFTQDPLDLSDAVQHFAMCFNLELKVMEKKTPYFCSKFFVPTVNDRWKMVPDIVKTVIKLGRRDLVNRQHVREFRQSLKDLYKDFNNILYVPYIDHCLADRYKPYGCEQVYSAIFTLINDDEYWDKLYFVPSGAVIDEKRGFSRQDF